MTLDLKAVDGHLSSSFESRDGFGAEAGDEIGTIASRGPRWSLWWDFGNPGRVGSILRPVDKCSVSRLAKSTGIPG